MKAMPTTPFPRLPRSAAFALLCCMAILSVLLLSGCRKVGLLKTPPPGATINLVVGPRYGKTDTEAELARRCIWTFVPPSWQIGAPVQIASAESGVIAAAVANDRYASVGFTGAFSGDGFTSFAANRIAAIQTQQPQQPDTIYLSMGIDGDQNTIAATALHEYGHVFYYRRLSLPQQAAWKDLWTDALARKALPTAYAATNEYEGFAESFAYYCAHKLADARLKSWFDALPR